MFCPVHLFEEHSSTLPVWWQAEKKPLTVVYLDAHLDLQQVDEEKISVLAGCKTVEQVKALEAPHHSNPASRFSFGIENFLYPALRLGLIERLVWVAPPHIPRSYSAAMLNYMQQMDGISFEELTSFRPAGGEALRGRLLDLDTTICSYQDLDSLDLPATYTLDVDIDYFVTVPADQLWINPETVIQSILGSLGTPTFTTISRAVSSGFTPLKFRFIGDMVEAIIQGNAQAARDYRALADIILYQQQHPGESIPHRLDPLLADSQAAAAALFYKSTLVSDATLAAELAARCTALDSNYAYDLAAEASGYPHRRKKLELSRLDQLNQQLDQLDTDSEQYNQAIAALAQLYAAAGQVGKAWELMAQLEGDLHYHGDIMLAVAAVLLGSDESDKAPAMLKQAASYDKIRSQATLYLGDHAFRGGHADKALAYYQQVHQRAPAWQIPLERIRLCHEVLENQQQLAMTDQLIASRNAELQRLTGN